MKKIYTILLTALVAFGSMAAAPTDAPARKAKRNAAAAPSITSLPASNITETGFTANWKAVPGAECYTVNVYEPVEITEAGTYTLISESFNLVNAGTFLEPYFEDNYIYFNFSETYDWTFTPDWWAYCGVFARGMVGGYIQSPYMDLTADGGKFKLNLVIVGYQTATVQIVSHGITDEKQDLVLYTTGDNYFTVEFTNGCHDTYISYADFGILDDTEGQYSNCWDFLDNFEVTQDYAVGDLALRPVAIQSDIYGTMAVFGTLPYANGAKHLAYDVQGVFVDENPDDPYDYDLSYTDFSELQHIYLLGYSGIENVEAETSAARYYNLQGIEVDGDNLPTGIYIKRQNNKSEKIIKK